MLDLLSTKFALLVQVSYLITTVPIHKKCGNLANFDPRVKIRNVLSSSQIFQSRLIGVFKLIHSGRKLVFFRQKNFDKSVQILKKLIKKHVFCKRQVASVHWDHLKHSHWIWHKILDLLHPWNSHLGQNWRFPYQIPLQRTNPPSPFNVFPGF